MVDRLSVRVVVTLASAVSLMLVAAPYDLHALHWFLLVPMFWVLRPNTPRLNLALGALYGTVAVGVLFRWLVNTITTFSNLPWWVAVVVLGLFSLGFGAVPYGLMWGAVQPMRKRLGSWWVITLPALQVLLEYASMYLLLFPYNQGVSQYRFPFTWQLVSVTGIWGLSFLIFFVNAALAEAVYRKQEGRPLPVYTLCAAVSTLSLTILFGAWRYEQVESALSSAPSLRIAQLQSDQGMEQRLNASARDAFDDWVQLTQAVPKGAADLVVWPEGACPYNLNVGAAARMIGALAKAGDFPMVVGAGTRIREPDPELGEERVRMFNSVYMIDKTGEITGHYDKMVPLPFGEYMPLADQLPWLADLVQGPGRFGAGEDPTILDGPVRIATPICYEAILPRVCRWFQDPDLLINVTNDAWFGDTAAPHQHAMLAAVRATELGVPMFRSAYTGVSMVIEPHGHIYAETQPFTRSVSIVSVRIGKVWTLYSALGDWFVALCAGVLALAVAWMPWRSRKT